MSLSLHLQAQLETRWWYFGFGAGLDFGSGTGMADTQSAQNGQGVGCAVQSDAEGSLMFYFLRDTIWNGQHQAMPGSTNILTALAEQNSVIVPYPNHDGMYYVFSVGLADAFGGSPASDFRFHLVDMSLENGLGDVVDTVKNVFICDSNA